MLILLFAFVVIYAYIRNKSFTTINIPVQKEPHLEHFTNPTQSNQLNTNDDEHLNIIPETIFISPETQQTLLQNIQSNYLSHFNQPNIQARGFDTRAELIRTYNKCIIPITNTEKSYITSNIELFLTKVNQLDTMCAKYIMQWIPKIQIAKGALWLESGMPHTHDNCMIMRTDWFNNKFNPQTFIHELTHIIQRKSHNTLHDWNILYQEWGFIQANKLFGLESQLTLNRINPDGMTTNWIWYSASNGIYYWIGAIFNSVNPANLTDVQYMAFPVTIIDAKSFKYTGASGLSLSSLVEFQNYFNIQENHYHPNEIGAQYAEYFFSDKPDTNSINNIDLCPGYKIFDKWAREYLIHQTSNISVSLQ